MFENRNMFVFVSLKHDKGTLFFIWGAKKVPFFFIEMFGKRLNVCEKRKKIKPMQRIGIGGL